MKVLQLVTTPRPFFDQQVAELERRGIDCTTVSVPRPPDGGRSFEEYARFYPAVLRRAVSDYDLVHANYGLVAPFALGQPTRPVVTTFWGTDLMAEASWLPRLSSWAGRRSDAVILPSRVLADRYPHDHTVVPFGVNTEQFRPIPQNEAREAVGWNEDETVVLFPYDADRPVKDYPRARRIVARLNADAELKTISEVPYEKMPYYINASDAVLLTSRRESGPMVVKEAAACNVPVVSTDVGFASDVLSDVSNSAVRDTDDGLVTALDAALAASERSDGRDEIDGLSVPEMADGIVDVYERALDGRAGA